MSSSTPADISQKEVRFLRPEVHPGARATEEEASGSEIALRIFPEMPEALGAGRNHDPGERVTTGGSLPHHHFVARDFPRGRLGGAVPRAVASSASVASGEGPTATAVSTMVRIDAETSRGR